MRWPWVMVEVRAEVAVVVSLSSEPRARIAKVRRLKMR